MLTFRRAGTGTPPIFSAELARLRSSRAGSRAVEMDDARAIGFGAGRPRAEDLRDTLGLQDAVGAVMSASAVSFDHKEAELLAR